MRDVRCAMGEARRARAGKRFAEMWAMATSDRLIRWGGARLSRRAARSVPWIGAVIALATVAGTMRRKGFFRGALDTGLNALPFLGAAKNAAEIVRGRDFIADRPRSAAGQPIPPARRPPSSVR